MSDFTMGATLTLTDNFSSTLTAAGHNAEAFKSQITGISSAMSSSTASMAETASAANGLGSGLQNVGSIADNMGSSMTDAVSGAESMADTIQEIGSAAQESQAPIQQSTESTNRWKAAMDQFDAGTQHLKQLPGTLKQIASQKLTGLVESMKNGVTSAKDLATNLKTMAQQKVTSLVASFREFKSTIQEGRTGVVGFVNALKNIGKISVTGAVNGVKSLASNMKTFAATKVSGIVNSLSNIKNKATDGKSGVEGLKTALQKVASTSLSALHSGLSKVGSLAKSAGSAVLSGLGKGITAITKGVAAGVTAAGTAVAGATAAAVKVGSNFEAAMSSVASISGATGSDFTALETKAKQMGATTAFSATEAANAMEYMAMAGWKTTDMVSGIDGIMNLAAASGADLAQTSDIVTDGLTAFGMKASESGRFADVMAAASANANTNVEMMGETFKYVGAAAGAMGYSIEDMAVATGLMANAGIKGSQAGTALRSTITRLAKPTKEAQTAMDALGLTVTNSDGSMKSFGTIMGDMRKGMQGMTEDQKAAYAAMLGGQEAMSGLLAIANASDEDFNKLTSAIQDSSGAAQEMAAIKLDNLQGDVTILKSGLEGLGIAIYDNIKGPLRSVTQTATEMVGSLSDALTNGGFSAFVAQLGNVLGQAVTMIASYAPQVVSMGVQLIQGFLSGIQANSGAIASGAASTIAAFINGLLVLIPQVIMIGGQLILQFVQGMIPQIPQLLTAATQAINTLVQGFISGLPMILQTANQLIMSLVQGIVQNAPMLIASAVQAITTFLSGILQMLPVILQAGVQLILGLAQGIISNIPLILQSAVLLIQQFATGLTQMLPTIIQGGIQLVISLIQGIISNLGTIAQAGVQIIVSLVTGLIQAIPMIIAAIPQLISAIIDTIFNTDWIAVGGEIINGIKDGFMSGFTSLVDSVKGLWSDFTGWLFGDGEEAGSAAGDGVASGVTSSSGNVASAASQTTQTATQNFQFDYGVLEGYGQQATNSVANGLNTGSGTLNYSATAVGTNTSNSILSGMQTVDLASGGTQATNSILAGLNTGGVQLTTTATTLGTETATNLNNSLLTGGAGLQATAYNFTDVQNKVNELLNKNVPTPSKPQNTGVTKVVAGSGAASFDKSLAGSYVTTTGLYMRHGAGKNKRAMVLIPEGTKVQNYGYYTSYNGTKWLYIQVTLNGVQYTGFSCKTYLKKQ